MHDDPTPHIRNILPRVHLVGAGPGDPGLITRKGAHLLASADVILYDHLVPLELLDLAPSHALRIDVGKIRNHPRMSQTEIEATMIDHARQGRTVVRLKGGDPFVFGRGGEEAQALQKAGIPFTVVPGVSSSVAVPAYAGVPLTHRDHNSRIVILTAHDNPAQWSDKDLEALSLPNQTIVVLMGVMYMKELSRRLLQTGLSPETPILLARWGTTPNQESFETTLGKLEDLIDRTPPSPPAILLIGDVVRLRPEVDWIHRLPLFGKRILLTREPDRASELGALLETLGATVISCPAISIDHTLSLNAEEALTRLRDYSWLLFLSPNGVKHFFREFSQRGIDLRLLSGLKIFSMGSATTEALSSVGIIPDGTPKESHGQAVVEAFSGLKGSHPERILIVRGDRGSGLIPEGLVKAGFSTDTISVYQNTLPTVPSYKRERLISLLEAGSIDLAIYYSPSAFSGLCEIFPGHIPQILGIPGLAIGPTTKSALEKGLLTTVLLSKSPTTSGVLDATLDFLSPMGNNSGVFNKSQPGTSPSKEAPFDQEERVSP